MSNNDSPLHLAIRNNNLEIAKVLLENKCDVHALNAEGMTPLQLATQTGNTEMVALLLKYGAGASPKASPLPSPNIPPARPASTTNVFQSVASAVRDFSGNTSSDDTDQRKKGITFWTAACTGTYALWIVLSLLPVF